MVKLSIVIPTLNEEKYVAGILSDLIKQTEKNFEVLVVDGESGDKTVAEVKKFAKKLTLKIVTGVGRGVSRQRNLGAKEAVSDLILFLDADVRVGKYFLENVWRDYWINPTTVSTIWSVSENVGVMPEVEFFIKNYAILLMKHIFPIIFGWAILVQKEAFFAVNGFDEKLFFAEDSDLCQRMVAAGGKLRLLTKAEIVVSSRRIAYEGRVNIYRKQASFLFGYLLHGNMREAQRYVIWKTGDFARLFVS